MMFNLKKVIGMKPERRSQGLSSALTSSMKTVDVQTKEVSDTDLDRPKTSHNI